MINQYDDYWFHESESVNLLKSGRSWWGEYIGTASALTILADLPDLIPSSNIIIRTSAIGSAQVTTKFLWQLNGQPAGETAIGTVGTGTYDIKAQKSESRFTLKAAENPASAMTVGVTYTKNGQSAAQAYPGLYKSAGKKIITGL